MTHWVNEYIGKSWERGAKGPDQFDCLGLVQHVQAVHYGVTIPGVTCGKNMLSIIRAIMNANNLPGFKREKTPKEGDVVKLYRHEFPDHIGIWVDVDGGGVLHSSQKNGVTFDSPFLLKSMGWEKIEYYRRSND